MSATQNAFNLIYEPWIPVEMLSGEQQMLSLQDVLLESGEIRRLATETAPLDAAVLRMLLALVHRGITEYDAAGQAEHLMDADDAFSRVEELWHQGKFPAEMFTSYFENHKNDFWLLSPDKGFGQAAVAHNGTEYSLCKMIPDLSQSENKTRIFSRRNGDHKNQLRLDEIARYILFVNGYDDTSSKASVRGLPSTGVGWLGKLGQIYAEGQNLFETLLLNCVMVKWDGDLWPDDQFSWEQKPSWWQERREISKPQNFGSYMTVRSRNLELKVTDEEVTGYVLVGGDFFDPADTSEPFTMWRQAKGKKGEPVHFVPKRHSSDRQIWRDFGLMVPAPSKTEEGEGYKQPGVLLWIESLENEEIIPPYSPITFVTPSIGYGDKDFFIIESSSQNLTFVPALLKESAGAERDMVQNMLTKIETMASAVGLLYKNLALIQRFSDNAASAQEQKGKAAVYDRVNEPFKDWLACVGTEGHSIGEMERAWNRTAGKLGSDLIRERMSKAQEQSGADALLGTEVTIKTKKESRKEQLSIFDAERMCRGWLNKIFPLEKESSKG